MSYSHFNRELIIETKFKNLYMLLSYWILNSLKLYHEIGTLLELPGTRKIGLNKIIICIWFVVQLYLQWQMWESRNIVN